MLTQNKKLIKNCKFLLSDLLRNDLKTYIKLFFWEKEVSCLGSSNKLNILVKAGLLTKNRKSYYANVMAYPLKDKFIITDFIFSFRYKKGGLYVRKRDQVWAMLPHETPQLIKNLKIDKDDTVLDLATGSGAIALFCADKAHKVYATDINPKAIKYAKFNATLNDLEHKIEFRLGDLFSPVKGLKFDYIVWNGPTVAAPIVLSPESTYALSDFGGPDGATFTRRFINQVRNYIKKDFVIQWYDSCLGNKLTAVSVDYLIKKFKNENYKIEINHLNKNRSIPESILEKLFKKYRFAKYPLAFDNFEEVARSERNWLKWIKKYSLNFVHFAIIAITQNSIPEFEIIEKLPHKSIVTPSFIYNEWHFMTENQIRKILRSEGTLKNDK